MLFTLAFSLLLAPAYQDGKAYVQPRLLIEPAELAKAENLKKFRVLDTRSQKQYEAGHIPGAHWLDTNLWKKSFKGPEDEAGWSRRIGALAIADASQPVVLYGDQPETARMWWILRFWGLKEVRMLNGGLQGWQAQKSALSKEPAISPPDAPRPKLSPAADRLATKNQILEALKDKSLAIIDTRTDAEYTGAKAQAKKGGTIPEACHLDWVEVIDAKTKRFKSAEELDKIFKQAGIDVTKPSVTFCQSGGRASVMMFAMELMGAKNVRNYYASWSEWGNAPDTPIVTPKKK